MWKSMWIFLWKTSDIHSTGFPPNFVEIFSVKKADTARARPVFHIFHSPYYYNCYLYLTFFSSFSASTEGKITGQT